MYVFYHTIAPSPFLFTMRHCDVTLLGILLITHSVCEICERTIFKDGAATRLHRCDFRHPYTDQVTHLSATSSNSRPWPRSPRFLFRNVFAVLRRPFFFNFTINVANVILHPRSYTYFKNLTDTFIRCCVNERKTKEVRMSNGKYGVEW